MNFVISEIWLWKFVYKYSKWSLFCKFWPCPHFQVHLLPLLDVQTLCDHFHEIFIKISWIVSEIFNVFCCPGNPFSTWKYKISCAVTSVDAAHFYRTQQCWSQSVNNSRIRRTVSEIHPWLYLFSTPPGKGGKGSKTLESIDKLGFLIHQIEDSFEFRDYLKPFSRSVSPTVKPVAAEFFLHH